MKKALFAVLCSWFLVGAVCADDLSSAVVSQWTAEGKTLEFYGGAIGRSLAATTRYFKYEFSSEGQITFNYGGGSTEQCSISIASNELHITDAAQQETVYTKAETTLNPCVQSLRQLDGALALYKLDRPEAMPPSLMDLVQAYLTSPPICPDGGIYSLADHPVCTIPEHSLEP
jgi:hypothetical protein